MSFSSKTQALHVGGDLPRVRLHMAMSSRPSRVRDRRQGLRDSKIIGKMGGLIEWIEVGVQVEFAYLRYVYGLIR